MKQMDQDELDDMRSSQGFWDFRDGHKKPRTRWAERRIMPSAVPGIYNDEYVNAFDDGLLHGYAAGQDAERMTLGDCMEFVKAHCCDEGVPAEALADDCRIVLEKIHDAENGPWLTIQQIKDAWLKDAIGAAKVAELMGCTVSVAKEMTYDWNERNARAALERTRP